MTRRQRLRWRLWNLGVTACDRLPDEFASCFVLHPHRLIADLPLTDADWSAAGWDTH